MTKRFPRTEAGDRSALASRKSVKNKKRATRTPEGGGPPNALVTRSQGIYSLCSSSRRHHMA